MIGYKFYLNEMGMKIQLSDLLRAEQVTNTSLPLACF